MAIRNTLRVDIEKGRTVRPGDDVIVTFDGVDCVGEVVTVHNGWYQCRIILDPLADWEAEPPPSQMSPVSYVMVREGAVKPCE
jgi:hypothetical protein